MKKMREIGEVVSNPSSFDNQSKHSADLPKRTRNVTTYTQKTINSNQQPYDYFGRNPQSEMHTNWNPDS